MRARGKREGGKAGEGERLHQRPITRQRRLSLPSHPSCPRSCRSKLKKEQLSLRDLDDFQPSVAKSLRTLLAYGGDDFEDVFGLTFCVTREAWGVPVSVDLVPGGADKPVTKANRRSYVAAYLKWLLTDAIRPQFDAFARGFANVAGGPALDLFRAEELALCVTGSPALDFGALQAAAVYEAPYTKDSPCVVVTVAVVGAWGAVA